MFVCLYVSVCVCLCLIIVGHDHNYCHCVCVCVCVCVLCECVCIYLVVGVAGRDRRYSGGQGMTSLRQRATRSSRDLLHGDDMEAVMADALVSRKYLNLLNIECRQSFTACCRILVMLDMKM